MSIIDHPTDEIAGDARHLLHLLETLIDAIQARQAQADLDHIESLAQIARDLSATIYCDMVALNSDAAKERQRAGGKA